MTRRAQVELETLARCNLCKSDRLLPIDPVCNICKCQSCGYIFDNPRPTFDEIRRFYCQNNKYDLWLAEEREGDYVWKRRLKKVMKHGNAGTLLDVGAGIGQFLYHAMPYFTEVYGTEISESAIDIAKAKYGLNIIKGDLTEIQFSRIAPFDNIVLFHVLEHVPDPKRLVEKCWSLLGKGGVLVIAVPNDILSLRMRLIRLRIRLRLRLKLGTEGYSDNNIGILGLRKITLS